MNRDLPYWVWKLIRNANFGGDGGGDGGGGGGDSGTGGGGGDGADSGGATGGDTGGIGGLSGDTGGGGPGGGDTGGATAGIGGSPGDSGAPGAPSGPGADTGAPGAPGEADAGAAAAAVGAGAGGAPGAAATGGQTGSAAMGGLGTSAVGDDASLGGFSGGFGGSFGFGDPSDFGGSPTATGSISTATGPGFDATEADTAGMGITGAAASGFAAPGGSSAPDSFGFQSGGFVGGDSPGVTTGVAAATGDSTPTAGIFDTTSVADWDAAIEGVGLSAEDQAALAAQFGGGIPSVLGPSAQPGPNDTIEGVPITSFPGNIDIGGTPPTGVGTVTPTAGTDFQGGSSIGGSDNRLGLGALGVGGGSALGLTGATGGVLTLDDLGGGGGTNIGPVTGAGGTTVIDTAPGPNVGGTPIPGTSAGGDTGTGPFSNLRDTTFGNFFNDFENIGPRIGANGNPVVDTAPFAGMGTNFGLLGESLGGEQIAQLTQQQDALLQEWAKVIPPNDPRWNQVVAFVQQQIWGNRGDVNTGPGGFGAGRPNDLSS